MTRLATIDVRTTSLPGLVVLATRRIGDERGYFSETWNRRAFAHAGIDVEFVQDNQSLSRPARTLRGLHFQKPPASQAKLVRVVSGAIYDVAVDLRPGSPTYGRFWGEILSAENGCQMFIPVGFAHGFCTLVPNTEVAYKVTAYYAPQCEAGIRWNDPELGIGWPLQGQPPVLSAKDRALPSLRESQAAWASPPDRRQA